VGELPRYVRGGATTPQCASLSEYVPQVFSNRVCFFPHDTMPTRYMHAMTLCRCVSVHPPVTSRFWATACKPFALCYWTVVCLSVFSKFQIPKVIKIPSYLTELFKK